jgi:hypothetical protein
MSESGCHACPKADLSYQFKLNTGRCAKSRSKAVPALGVSTYRSCGTRPGRPCYGSSREWSTCSAPPWPGSRGAMEMIVHAAHLQRGEFVCAANSARITPDILLHIRHEPAFAVFGGENDVHVQRRERVGHHRPQRRDSGVACATQFFGPASRGLKPTANHPMSLMRQEARSSRGIPAWQGQEDCPLANA